jgi:hypothetical protein
MHQDAYRDRAQKLCVMAINVQHVAWCIYCLAWYYWQHLQDELTIN